MTSPLKSISCDSVFKFPLDGKPDTHIRRTGSSLERDPRPRKYQKGAPLSCSWYYALNILRTRLSPPEEVLEASRSSDVTQFAIGMQCLFRCEEKFYSGFRKRISEWHQDSVFLQEGYKDGKAMMLVKLTRDLLGKIQELNSKMPMFPDLLGSYNSSIVSARDSIEGLEFSLSTVRGLSVEILNGLQTSEWSPEGGIIALIKEMSLSGPMAVEGEFGCTFYEKPPQLSSCKIEEREVYYWPKGAVRKANSEWLPMIVIVGVEKQGDNSGLVYFIDPREASDPLHPENRKLYMMSYNNFTIHVRPMTNMGYSKRTTWGIFGYAGLDRYRPEKADSFRSPFTDLREGAPDTETVQRRIREHFEKWKRENQTPPENPCQML